MPSSRHAGAPLPPAVLRLADAEVARFADAIRGADPATPVPTVGTPADHRPRLTVTGDPALLAHWRQHALI